MTTQNIQPENNDWQAPDGGQLSASATSDSPETTDAPLATEQASAPLNQDEDTLVKADSDDQKPEFVDQTMVQDAAVFSLPAFSDQEAWLTFSEQPSVTFEMPVHTPEVSAGEQFSLPENISAIQEIDLSGSQFSFLSPLENETLLPGAEEVVRPFTDFIEEFRQREVRLNALLNEPETSFTTFVAKNEAVSEVAPSVAPIENILDEPVASVASAPAIPEVEEPANVEAVEQPFAEPDSAVPQPKLPAERPVSPLLRPATRIRLPRHGRHRIEELIQPAELQTEAPAVEEKPAPMTLPIEEAPARPARRYRFDRPAASASVTPAPVPTVAVKAQPVAPSAQPAPARSSGTKEKRENGSNVEFAAAKAANSIPTIAEVAPQKTVVQEMVTVPSSVEVETPSPTSSERRRRGNHDRQREKEQTPTAQAAPVIPEISMPEPEPVASVETEVPLEDLPPLEYSELQAASSRRRRRRRAGSASTLAATNGTTPAKAALPEIVMPAPIAPASVVPLPKSTPPAPVTPSAVAQSYNIVSGYTVSQMNQGNDATGPFMGPEPSPARGSTFSTPSSLRHSRGEALRSTTPGHPTKHTEGQLMPVASINYLANTVAQAVQTQTDRMVAELRRANQVPTNVSVSLPPFPSTERVGVFVDVANLLYSARTLRMTVDFGKLLDFLRGNRRLVRAQAYCPTSPQPGDDQMFLQAVKGLGYRITTKNYKTFSSGAKKADLDLDLCMDVVRLVDGRAVDCIVLVSGDSDFMPMLDYCSDHGVRVEVAAFDESMSATLRQSCDLFVNLSMLEEIRS